AEAPLAEDVRQRLALLAAGDVGLEGRDLHGRELPVQLGVEESTGAVVAGAGEQQLGLEPGRVDSRLHQPGGGRGERAAESHAVSSARRRSSAASASVNSSSSPSRILSSRCTVWCTRWSVRRFSGKL